MGKELERSLVLVEGVKSEDQPFKRYHEKKKFF